MWARETKNFYEIDQIFPAKVAKFNRLGSNFWGNLASFRSRVRKLPEIPL
jgi:hypothetical protein